MSDAHRDEIAKLEALYSENPEGRVFTHLAEACRKGGDLDRAREVLTEGIERHPDYSSAHVVLGKVLMDLDQYDEAQAEFRRVLELDGQNLVALRSLGDIARAEGRPEDALEHYYALLELEPSDTDVTDLVEELSETLVVPGSSEAEEEPAPGDGAEDTDTPGAIDAGPELDEEAGDDWAEAAALETDDWSDSAEQDEAGESQWVGSEWTAEDQAPAADPEPDETAGSDDEEDGDAFDAAAMDRVAEAMGELDGEDAEGEDVMTETIAQVYARQGLYDRAAEVYRELVRANPDDEALQERLAEMEEQAAAAGEVAGDGDGGESGTAHELGAARHPEGVAEPEADPEVEGAAETAGGLAGFESEEREPEALDPDEDALVSGFESTEFEAEPTEAASLEGFQSEERSGETGLAPPDTDAPEAAGEDVTADEVEPDEAATDAVEAGAADAGEPEELVDEPDAVPEPTGAMDEEADSVWTPADEGWDTSDAAVGNEADDGMAEEPVVEEPVAEEPVVEEPVAEDVETPWTEEDWSEEDTESPYAWGETESGTDTSPPIREYLEQLLDWGGTVASAGVEDASTGGTASEVAEPGAGSTSGDRAPSGPAPDADDGDDDLEMFRSWLESLKQ